MPIKSARATLGVTSVGENKTETYMHVDMTPKNFILKPFMYMFFRFIAAPGILKGLEKLHKTESQLKMASV